MFKKAMVLLAMAGAMQMASAVEKTVQDSVTWQVTAVKDAQAALVVVPQGNINLKFLPGTGQFAQASANFWVSVLKTDAVVAGSTFTLSAVQTEGTVTAQADLTKGFKVVLYKDGMPLSSDISAPTILNDSSTSGDFLAHLNGLSTTPNRDSGTFVAFAKPLTTTSTDMILALPDGDYRGQVTVAFNAVWNN